MLIVIYNRLFIMSVVFGILYLALKILSSITLKFFKVSWHYYTYISIYLFLVLPYHKLISFLIINQRLKLFYPYQP